ncbi:hypothetical protein KSP39_PZI008890 [Platanthera zijinensis]|uniref:Retrotransposon gag domain-containing protein n=1 Tax=Platanthera zijinensis TaxID=2320716 RepID=A0AAP0BK94_9ASPA
MAKRSARAAEEPALGGHTEPARSHPLVDVPLTAEAAFAPVTALEGRVRQMEEQQTEMLTLLRNMGAPPAPPRSPPPANHPPLFNPPRNQEDPVEQEGPEDHSDAASSAHPHLGRTRADHPRNPVNDAPIHPLLTRQEIREAVAEECRQAARRDFHLHRPLYQGSPFIQQILDHPIPQGFKLPNIETFDGTDDPLEHVNHFTTIMRIFHATDQLLCQVFPTTLKGQARTWFHSLRPGIVTSFAELTRQFSDQFIANRRIVRDTSHLSGIRQSEGETLKEFFQRFTAEARQIPGVDPELLRGVIEAQIAADEAIEAHRRQFDGVQKRQRDKEPIPQRQEGRFLEDRQSGRRRRDSQRDPPRDYTPLNTSRTSVLYAIQNEPALQRPRQPPPNPRNDQSKYCEYHRTTGHTTEECARLKEEIERLVRLGLLGRFLQGRVQEQQDPPRRPRDQQNPPPAPEGGRQVVGNIETIAGSPILTSQILSVHSGKEAREDKKSKQDTTISFGDEDLINVRTPHQDPLVISAGIGNPCYNVKRILVDNGSSVNVLFSTTLQNMDISRQQLTPAVGPIYDFDNHQVQVIGTVTLPVTLGEFLRQTTHEVQFVVVDSNSAYNAIFGRPVQTTFKAIPSIPHLAMKFPTPGGIGIVRGNQEATRSCYSKQAQPTEPTTLNIDDFDLRDEAVLQRGAPIEGLIEVPLSSTKPDRTVQLGSLLQEQEKERLAAYLRRNKDIFAWSPEDMPGIDPQVIHHSLNINPACKPVIQKKRNFAPERLRAIEEEVEKLLRAQFIREVGYPAWVANFVLVKKSSGKWRMCVDYTNLNQACPKDSFPLPRIDQLVDSTAGH